MTPARGREMIDFVWGAFGVSIRKACRAIPACRATYHYRSRRPEQAPLRKRIREIQPTDNAYVESFNATGTMECLGRHWFFWIWTTPAKRLKNGQLGTTK